MVEKHTFEVNSCVVFQYRVCQLSPDRSINLSDLGIGKDKLPTSLRKVLQHPVIPKEKLRPLSMYNGRLSSALDDFACRTDLGWLVPPHKFGELCEVVEDVATGIEGAKQKLIEELPAMRQAVIDKVNGYQINDAIKRKLIQRLEKQMPDEDYVSEQVRFWHVFSQLGSVDIGNKDLQQQLRHGLFSWFEGLFGCVIDEVIRKAKAVRRELIKNDQRTQVTQKTVQQLRDRLVEKIEGLKFISNQVTPLADSLAKVMDQFPKTGPLSGADYDDFMTVLECLSDANYISRCLIAGKPLFERKVVKKTVKPKASKQNSVLPKQETVSETVISRQTPAPVQQNMLLNF